MASTADSWAVLHHELQAGGSYPYDLHEGEQQKQADRPVHQRVHVALQRLLDSRLPAASFTADRVECLGKCVLFLSPGPAAGVACSLLSHWALLTVSPSSTTDPSTAHLLQSSAKAAISLVETQPQPDVWASALHCLALCCLGTRSPETLDRTLSLALDSRPAGLAREPGAATKAARALGHLALASLAHGLPRRASEAGGRIVALWQGEPGCLPPLQDISALLQRLSEVMLKRMPNPIQHVEGTAGSSSGLVRSDPSGQEPPQGGPEALQGMARAFCQAICDEDAEATGRAVGMVAGAGLLRAWHGTGHHSTVSPGVGAIEQLECVLLEAIKPAPCDMRSSRLAAAVALAPGWRPRPQLATPATALCLVEALLTEKLQLSPLFQLAALGRPPSDGERWLAALRQRGVLPEPQVLLAEAMGHLRVILERQGGDAKETARALLTLMEGWAKQLHLGFCDYVSSAERDWLEPSGKVARLLRSVLSDMFTVSVGLLTLVDRSEQARGPAQTLGVLACVEFARVPLVAHGQLLTSCLSAVASDHRQAGAVLDILSAAAPELIPSAGGPDLAIRSTRTLLLMRAASLALPAASGCWGLAVLAEVVIPVATPHIRKGPQQLSAASHSLCCQLLRRAANEDQQTPTSSWGEGHVVEPMASYYLSSALDGFPAHTSAKELGLAASAILAALPADSPVVPWAVGEMARRAIQIASGAKGSQGEAEEDSPEWQLMHLASECLTQVGIMVQEAAMSEVQEALLGAPVGARGVFLTALQKRIANSDNAVMKSRWVRWYHRLVEDCAASDGPGRCVPPPMA